MGTSKGAKSSNKLGKKANSSSKKATGRASTLEIRFKDETKVHPALKQYFGYCLFKLAAQLRQMHDKILLEWGIQTQHLGILKVAELEPISQIVLGEQMGIDKASMVKALDHLEKLKYLERVSHPTDRRVKMVQLTRHGSSFLQSCMTRKTVVEQEFFKNLTEDEIQSFLSIMTKLINTEHQLFLKTSEK